jgi:hypothetical protein
LSINQRIISRRRSRGRAWYIGKAGRERVSDRAHCNRARIRVPDGDRVPVLRVGLRCRAVSGLGGYESFHSLRRKGRHVRVCGRATCRDGEIPTDPGAIVQWVCAGAHIRERCVGTDGTPDIVVVALEEIVAARQWDQLFNSIGGRIVLIDRASHRLARAAEALSKAVAEIRPRQERIPGAIEDTASGG